MEANNCKSNNSRAENTDAKVKTAHYVTDGPKVDANDKVQLCTTLLKLKMCQVQCRVCVCNGMYLCVPQETYSDRNDRKKGKSQFETQLEVYGKGNGLRLFS